MAFQTLETDNFILKPASLMETSNSEDYDRFAAMCLADDQALLELIMGKKVFDDDTGVEEVKEALVAQDYAKAGLLGALNDEFYFVQSKQTGEFVGKISLYKDRYENFQFSIFTLPSHRGKGIMSEIYPAIAEHTRENGYKIDYMEARADGPFADSALRLLLKDGFEVVSTEPFKDNPDGPHVVDESGSFHRLERPSGPGGS